MIRVGLQSGVQHGYTGRSEHDLGRPFPVRLAGSEGQAVRDWKNRSSGCWAY